MRVATIIQTKGGSGKTTLAMAIASGGIARGRRVLLLDADRNPQALEWPQRFEQADWETVKKMGWPETLEIDRAPASIEDLYERLNQAEEAGVDLVVIDTRPGTHEDTEDLAYAADLVLIPARPSQMDYQLVQDAFVWMHRLKEAIAETDPFPKIRTVVTDAPAAVVEAVKPDGKTDGLSKRDYDILAQLIELPHLDVILPNSKIWSNISYFGPLSTAADAHAASRAGRLMVPSLRKQVRIAEALYDEVMEA